MILVAFGKHCSIKILHRNQVHMIDKDRIFSWEQDERPRPQPTWFSLFIRPNSLLFSTGPTRAKFCGTKFENH